MNTNSENTYYHGNLGSSNRHDNDKRNQLRDGDFGREYENRYRNQDGRNRKAYDEYKSSGNDRYNYGSSWGNTSTNSMQRGYERGNYEGSGYGYDSDRNGNDRTPGPKSQGGYGTGRMGGYSGAAFGGSNYSSKGTFGGSPAYGSMSGGGGNMSRGASSSGYGYSGRSTGSDRGVPDYNMDNISWGEGPAGNYGSSQSAGGSSERGWGNSSYRNTKGGYSGYGSTSSGDYTAYRGYGSNNERNGGGNYRKKSDRGGYTDYDPNNRWNS